MATVTGPSSSIVGNIAFFDNTSGSSIGAAPAFQSGNPANAALVSGAANPPVDGTIYNFMQVSVGSPITALNQWGGDADSIHHGVVGTMDIPAGSALVQGAALAGYAVSRSSTNSPLATPPAAIGIYGQATIAVADGNAFASNCTALNGFNFGTKAARDFRAFNANFVCASEGDVGLYQTAPGVDPFINGPNSGSNGPDGGNAVAYYASGGGNFTGVIGSGFVCGQASTMGGRRAWGFRTEDGVTVGGMLIGAAGAGNNVGSQTLSLRGRDSGGTNNLATLAADPNGTLLLTSPSLTALSTNRNIAAATLNNVVVVTPAITAVVQPGAGSTFSTGTGKTIAINNSLTFAGTDGTVLTTPGASDALLGRVSDAGKLPATATNDDAPAGSLGEYLFAGPGSIFGPSINTATITLASPAVVTMVSHGFSNTGTSPVVFSTMGVLPNGTGGTLTPIVAGTVYWSVPGSITSTTFQIATSPANALAGIAINTGGTQSGTHTADEYIPLGDATNANFGAVKLTAGDWDVGGSVAFRLAATTSVVYWWGCTNTASATGDQQPGRFYGQNFSDSGVVLGSTLSSQFVLPTRRIKVSNGSTQIIYGVLQAHFSLGAASGAGSLWARRMR
jgi:hypothetical protein